MQFNFICEVMNNFNITSFKIMYVYGLLGMETRPKLDKTMHLSDKCKMHYIFLPMKVRSQVY